MTSKIAMTVLKSFVRGDKATTHRNKSAADEGCAAVVVAGVVEDEVEVEALVVVEAEADNDNNVCPFDFTTTRFDLVCETR